MDQEALRELESRCVQEEPPWCTAACPLHVDGRSFAGHIGNGRWEDAWKVLQRYMPLPGILGRICDAPCEDRCKRSQAGGAIRMGALERVCVQSDPPKIRSMPIPAREKKVAVTGSGLSSLTAAGDLAGKGYTVTVFETTERPGDPLRQWDPVLLPTDAIDREIEALNRKGIHFELGKDCDSKVFADRCLNLFDAIYLGLDAVSGRGWDLRRNDDGIIRTDTKTGQTSHAAVFAGGRTPSPVWRAAHGRWAATSIDRFLQGVSLTAGRDREGPLKTRLFTSLSDVTPLPTISAADESAGYTRSEAEAEAQRCLQCQCMECVKVCAYMESFGAYPKKYAREVYNNLSIVMGERKSNRLINSCSLCGLCRQVCPNDFAMQDLCLHARQAMVERGKMPPSAHEFALLDMAFSQSDRFFLARHQPGHETSVHLFFPGCQLCASAPAQVEKVYNHLRSSLSEGVGLMLGCCGAPAHWAGQRKLFEDQAACLQAQWDTLGRPRMILACSTCVRMFKDHLPQIPTVSLWSVIEAHPPSAVTSNISLELAVHDPCTTRHEAEMRACVRRLIAGCGLETEELSLGSEKTECCGFGGLMHNANPELAGAVAQGRAGRSDSDYVAYCAMCRDNLAARGKRVIHLLDLYFPDSRYPDPALRPRPDWSRRQENRARLRDRLLQHLWHEAPAAMKAHQSIRLEISPEVAKQMDQRRIMVEDLQKVIQHAESSGERLFHPPSGRYKAAYAPYKVTFWVEYTPVKDGFVVHNAYAHRMEVIGP
ncbi:MAG: 4Fe-4S dicluster domain-containing protein [Desulfobacteraceae bacterium]|jgi:Fe-S oxidoreductase